MHRGTYLTTYLRILNQLDFVLVLRQILGEIDVANTIDLSILRRMTSEL